ncbi:MAG: hypothetical protein ABSA03_22690 [Streptosporangiaceae bacterium]|jgi:hypothetical protein
MEITTILPARQVIIASQRAAAMASRQPRRGRRAIRVVLTRVERGALHYEARIARRQIRTVTVRFTADPEVTRVSIDGADEGAPAAFAAHLHLRIHAADPAAACSQAASGSHALCGRSLGLT